MTLTAKFVTSFVCALLAVISCACLEWARKHALILGPDFPEQHKATGPCIVGGKDYCSSCAPRDDATNTGTYMSQLSAWYYTVPVFFVALSEMFALPSTQYFAYAYTPPKMRTMLQAFWLIVLNSYSRTLSTLCMNFGWATEDLNVGYIEGYYYFSIGFLLLFLCFLGCRHHNRAVHPDSLELIFQWENNACASDAKALEETKTTWSAPISSSTAPISARLNSMDKSLSVNLTQHQDNQEPSSKVLNSAKVGVNSGPSVLSHFSDHSFRGAMSSMGSFTDDALAGF